MKSYSSHYSLLLLLICCSTLLRGQLIIAKDPRACLVGLKDSSGNWIVSPVYTSIGYYGSNYKVLSGDKQGIINSSGKVLVHAIYDKVEYGYCELPGVRDNQLTQSEQKRRWRYSSYFIVTNNAKAGLISPDGKELLPPSLLSLTHFFDGVAIGVNEQKQNVLVDTTGILCTLPVEYSIRPESNSMLATNRFLVAKKEVTNKAGSVLTYGVCDERGKFILPTTYRGFHLNLWRLNVLLADSAGRYGVFSLNGKKLSPFCYRSEKTPSLDKSLVNDFLFVSRESGTGVLGKNGKLIVPCTYDSISATWKSMDETLFLCHLGSHDDLFSEAKAILVNHHYDQVRIVHNDQLIYHDLVLLLVKKDQKWGALSESLAEYMPIEFDTVFKDEYFILFYSDSSVRALYCSNPENKRQMIIVPDVASGKDATLQWSNPDRPYFTSSDTIGQVYKWNYYDDESGDALDTFYLQSLMPVNDYCEVIVHELWTTDSVHLIWELPVDIEFLPGCEANQYNHDATSCFAVVKRGSTYEKYGAYKSVADSTLYISTEINGSSIYRAADGFLITPRTDKMNFYLYGDSWGESESYIRVQTSTGHQGRMNLRGEMVRDTLWYGEISLNRDTSWVRTKPTTSPYNENDCNAAWNLYSYKEQRFLLDQKDQLLAPPSQNPQEICPAMTTSGVGLFDMQTLRFTIAPLYQYIFPLDDSMQYFLVTDLDGVTRITNRTGKPLNKFSVTNSAVINKTTAWYTDPHLDSFLMFSVITSGPVLIAGNFGVRNYFSMDRDSLFDFLLRGNDIQKHYRSLSGAPMLLLDSNTSLRRWQKELLCDSFILSNMNPDYRKSPGSGSSTCYPSGFREQTEFACDTWSIRKHVSLYRRPADPAYTCCWYNRRVLCFKTQTEPLYEPAYTYETYFLEDTIPVKQQLSDLFVNDQWKSLVIEVLLARLDSQPQIRANCSEPNRYPDLLATRFLVSSDSLLLYPDWGMDRYLQNPEICVAISWIELTPFLKPKVKEILEIQ